MIPLSLSQGLVKEAIIQKAILDVPWTAEIVTLNGLGVASKIDGQWRGISTYNLRVTQTGIDGICLCAE